MSWHTFFREAVRLLGVAGSAYFGLLAYAAYAVFHPLRGAYAENVAGLAPTVLLTPVASYYLATFVGARHWPALGWAARGLLAVLAFLAWRFWSFAGWREALTWIGLIVFGLVLHHVAHRYALGWIIDARGERQKVTAENRGYSIYTPTTRNWRLMDEIKVRGKRRARIFWFGLGGLPLGVLTWREAHQPKWLLAIPIGYVALIALVPFVWNIVAELLYQVGWQDMEGAKVLDPPPAQPGLDSVHAQKVYGDPQIASEADALSLLDPRH